MYRYHNIVQQRDLEVVGRLTTNLLQNYSYSGVCFEIIFKNRSTFGSYGEKS